MHSSGTFLILLRFAGYASLQLFFQTFQLFAIYRNIFGVGNFLRGFFVCSERKCAICVSVLFCFYLLQKLNSPHYGGQAPARFHYGLSRLSEVTIFVTDACMLNRVREGEED